jgi:hypothetical protein
MSSNSIPPTLRDLLTKLEFLSMIEQGMKPCVGDMTFVDGSSWYGAVTRALKGEGKRGLMMYLNQIVEQSIEAINEYRETSYLPFIVHALASAKRGIENLEKAYQNQPDMISQIRVCVTNIKIQLEENKELLRKRYSHLQKNPDSSRKSGENTAKDVLTSKKSLSIKSTPPL